MKYEEVSKEDLWNLLQELSKSTEQMQQDHGEFEARTEAKLEDLERRITRLEIELGIRPNPEASNGQSTTI